MDSSQHTIEQKTSFHSRVKESIIAGAKDYYNYFVRYDYLIVSDAFVRRKYYIISGIRENYLHLTGVNTDLSAKDFYFKCFPSDYATLQESDFSIVKEIDSSLPEEEQKMLKKQAKGTVRKKIQALSGIKGIFSSPNTLMEEDFKKNQIYCTMAAEAGKSTMGFIKASVKNDHYLKPCTLLKEQSLSPQAKPIKLVLRKKRKDELFNEIIIGNEEILRENIGYFRRYVSPMLLKNFRQRGIL